MNKKSLLWLSPGIIGLLVVGCTALLVLWCNSVQPEFALGATEYRYYADLKKDAKSIGESAFVLSVVYLVITVVVMFLLRYVTPVLNSQRIKSLTRQLEELRALKESGVLTEQQYKEKEQAIQRSIAS